MSIVDRFWDRMADKAAAKARGPKRVQAQQQLPDPHRAFEQYEQPAPQPDQEDPYAHVTAQVKPEHHALPWSGKEVVDAEYDLSHEAVIQVEAQLADQHDVGQEPGYDTGQVREADEIVLDSSIWSRPESGE